MLLYGDAMLKPVNAIDGAIITRRGFFERLGLIGGSSLVMTAMSSLDLMAGQAGARPTLSGRPRKSRVVVLGAGMSGLVVGYELGRLGYDYRILEARERVGGVAWTVRRGTEHTEIGGERQVCGFDPGLYINVGPWRIPYTHTGVLGYCKELGVPMELFVNEAENAYFFYEGEAGGPLAGRRVRLREVKADMIGHTNELIAKAIDQRQLDLPLTAEDRDKFVTYLTAHGYLDAKSRRYGAFETRGGGDPYPLEALLRGNFTNRLRSIAARSGTSTGLMFQPIGGMDQIAFAFQRVLGKNHITLNEEVVSVHQTETNVKVVHANTKNGKKTETTADYVVVCLPLSCLANADINLSPELMTHVKATTYSNSAKVGLAMKRRFWEDDDGIFGGHLYSNLPLGEFSYPSNDYFSAKGVLLGLYANGPVGDLLDQPVQARVDHVLTHASKVHPQIRQEFESAYAVWWRKVKYSLGGYASGGGAERRRALAAMDNRVVIGSAATAPYSSPDWLEGAVASAWTALTNLHERAMRG
jgi:monoamine oxidase